MRASKPASPFKTVLCHLLSHGHCGAGQLGTPASPFRVLLQVHAAVLQVWISGNAPWVSAPPAWEPQMKPLAPGLSLVQPRLQGQHSGARQQGPGWSPWLLAAAGIPTVKQQAHALSSSLLCLLPKEEKSLFKINGERSQHSGTCIPYRHQLVSHSLRFPSNSLFLWLG